MSSKVIDFGTNRKCICNLSVSVRNSNLGPILHHFRDIAGFCARDLTPYSTLILGGVPVAPDRSYWDQPEHKP